MEAPIILIEDDPDDFHIFSEVISEMNLDNELLWCKSTADAYDYILKDKIVPLLIISDLNLPDYNEILFRKELNSNETFKKLNIPCIFYSTISSKATVNLVYDELPVQGLFIKNTDYNSVKNTIHLIINYWKQCRHPLNPLY